MKQLTPEQRNIPESPADCIKINCSMCALRGYKHCMSTMFNIYRLQTASIEEDKVNMSESYLRD